MEQQGQQPQQQQQQQQGPRWTHVIVQGLVIMMVYRYISSSSSSSSSSGSTTTTATTSQEATKAPPVPPQKEEPPGMMQQMSKSPQQEGAGMMDAVMGNMLQGRKLTPELEYFDMERRRKLYNFPKGTVLRNLWPSGQTFNLYVFVSTSAAPLRQLPLTEEDQEASADPSGVSFPLKGAGTQSGLTWWFQGRDWDKSETAPAEEQIGLIATTFKKVWGLFGSTQESSDKEEDIDAIENRGKTKQNAIVWDNLRCPNRSARTAGPRNADATLLFFQEHLSYDWDIENDRQLFVNMSLPECIRSQNISMFAHIYAAAEGFSPDPQSERYRSDKVISFVHPLMSYRPKMKQKDTRNLLSDSESVSSEESARAPNENLLTKWFGITFDSNESSTDNGSDDQENTVEDTRKATGTTDDEFDGNEDSSREEDDDEQPIVRYWKPTLEMHLLHDFSGFKVGQFPPFYPDYLQAVPSKKGYIPILYANEFWILTESLIQVNESTDSAPLELSYNTMSTWIWQLQLQMQNSWDLHAQWGTQGEKETDQIKSLFLDTNPILLVVTMVVSTLHMLFDFLAFKNDISFWRNTKSMKGLSLRSIALNLFFQVVIFLYLLDNDTSWMILISSLMGLVIEVWKLRKAVSVNVEWKEGELPRLNWSNKDEGYVNSNTKKYDDLAMLHLSYAIYPLIVGYAIYSLIYERHRGWYSWVLSSLTGFVYAFGFILMTPQLFINYKMKSVAHLPWRAMVYKSLNTFIDDLFAFVIKMPTMHRLSCFRDDIIFFIYLYQRWIYPVDKSRRNEFGASAEDYENMEARKKGIQRKVKRSKFERRLADGKVRDAPLLKTSEEHTRA